MEIQDDAYILYISRGFLKWNHQRYILYGENCTTQLEKQDETTNGQKKIRDRFVINITATEANCISCYTPVKVIDAKIVLNTTLQQYNFPDDGNKIDPSKASVLMQDMARLVSSSNESTIAVSAGEGVTGILQKTEPLDPEEISFAYSQSTDDLQDEQNSTVLGDEVVAVEMGRTIKNLTDTININFLETDYTPPDEISSSDLNTLTIITQAGCGISMFFLGIVLFMHCLLRKGKATKATTILIHLVLAMFFLNFTFLTNNFVAKTKNDVGCKIMAALMHYFMLATLTLFAVQAFHICLQLYKVIPSIIAVVLFSTGKYGEQVIYTDSVEDNVAMCWITDVDIHYFVSVSYYALVFLFTFTTFIITLSWLHFFKRSKSGSVQAKRNGISITTILGLCCMLGITWGFAFFAYGVLRMPATYIFTVLNSFQGFFLFIYYHFTSHSKETDTAVEANTESSSTTQKTGLDIFENPYNNPPAQGKK
ncbi:hypothetical protein INR49_026307 [Caranx melampygus]|nr:hypothetical protein INR49_026307 [Caranx melampygus]